MSDRETFDPLGVSAAIDSLPGFHSRSVGPFGVPVPVPDADDGSPPSPARGDSVVDRDQSQDAVIEAAEAGEDYLDRVEQAIETENCDFCRSVLNELRTRPLDEQVKGVGELAELKRSVDGEVNAEEIEQLMDEFEVITDPSIL